MMRLLFWSKIRALKQTMDPIELDLPKQETRDNARNNRLSGSSEKLNILFFCQLYPPAIYGGGEYIFFQYARELARRGHRVFAIAQRLKGVDDFELIDGINVFRTGPSIEYHGVLPISLRNNIIFVHNSLAKGMKIVAENKIDIIHSNTYVPALAGYSCAKAFRKPHVVTFHDVYYLRREAFWGSWGSQGGSKGLVSFAGPLVEQLLLRLPSTVFHAVSKTSAEDLLFCNVKDAVVIPNGIDMLEYSSSSTVEPEDFQVIFIGRLVFYKNVETIIRAFKKVVKSIPGGKLVIVGDGPMKSALIALTADLGLEQNVVFAGNIPLEEKVRLLKSSSFLALPSVIEGFGIVLLEAFACSKPVLVSSVKPLTEIVENGRTGYFVSPFDVDAWADRIIEMFNNPIKTAEMGICGKERLEQNYTIPRVVDQLEDLYFSLLSGRGK